MSDFNGWDFSNDLGDNRRKIKYLVIADGDLDLNNAIGCKSIKDVKETIDYYDSFRSVSAVFKVDDITRKFIK